MGGIFTETMYGTLSQILVKVPLEKTVCILLKSDVAHIILALSLEHFFNDKFPQEWAVDVKQIHGRKIT
jgi:hypothetical protein